MWEIGNRGVVGLLSVLVGSVILYNAWELILVLAILLFFVVNTCYSLLVNDSLVSPLNLLVFKFVKEIVLDLSGFIEQIKVFLFIYIGKFVNAGKRYYHQRYNSSLNMNRPRRSSYHLSSDSLVKARESSYSNTNELSPIPRERFQHIDDWGERTRIVENSEPEVKYTSTPLVPWKKENVPNGEPQHVFVRSSPSKVSPLQGRNHTLSRGEETFFSPEGSPWGTSISPKMRAKAAGVKTVQTVAGPLLASTRYNIDTKVYTDVTSPGLTTRLSKYASEINNKLLHQPQYGMGHFPKVNLSASPAPLINTRAAKMRMPVTVRIAQPETIRYSSSDRQKMLNMICQPENQSPPNVVQALREISLKRHASREDVTSELVKKQRTDGIYSDELENLEEMTQKRARDESSKSDEEISPSHTNSRPLKRTKGQSCNDILNSLSSSIHVFSGVKRKAMDISRSSTPDFEKHFKSLEKYPSESFSVAPQERDTQKMIERHTSEPLVSVARVPINCESQSRNEISPKDALSNNTDKQIDKSQGDWEIKRPQPMKKSKSPSTPVKLSDKLFMRAEPENNDKLRNIIEERSNVKDKFSLDDKDEIKKKDIVNMRQTSMRARLQSMFDAISGKGAKKINPDVVIQAEEVTDKNCIVITPLTTLSSMTTTTNVNTSPISSPIVPILKKDNKKSPNKRVTFNLPSEIASTTTSTSSATIENASKIEQVSNTSFSTNTPSQGFSSASTIPLGVSSSSTTPFQTSVVTSSNADTSKDKVMYGSNFLTSKTETTPILATNKPNLSTDTQTLNNSQSLNISNATTTTFAASSGFTFGTVAKSSPSVPLSLPTATLSSSSTAVTPSFTFETSKPVTQAFVEQNIPKTQPPSFGSVTSGFSFSNKNSPATTISNVTPVETISSVINNPVKTSSFSFGSAPSTKSGFTFITPSTTTSCTPIFGATTSTSILNATTNVTTCAPSFGLAATTIPSFTSPANFGAGNTTLSFDTPNQVSNQVKSFGSNASTPSLFGTPTTSTNSISFKPSNSQPIFGNSSSGTPSAFGIPKTTASASSSSLFTASSNTPAFGTATNTPSLFTNSNVNSTSVTTLPTFGSSVTTSNLFNQVNTNTVSAPSAFAPSTTSSGLFSNINTNTTGSNTILGASSSVFSQPKPPAFGSTSSTFGNTSCSLFATSPANSATSAFGATNSTASFAAQTSGTPAAVSQNSNFGFNTTTSNTNTPTFGSTAATPGFGVNTNNSFQTPINTGINFGTGTSNPPAFGSSTSTFGSQGGNVFATNTPASSFGATATATSNNNNNNNSSSSGNNNSTLSGNFTFGANQNQIQSTSTFSFGGASANNNNNASSNNNSATPFQFGSATSKPATGFNFNAPLSTPSINFGASANTSFNVPAPGTNNFTAPTGGMFSIGTGSTAPRSRTARSRRQR